MTIRLPLLIAGALGGDPDIQADLRRPDFPIVAIPAEDDSRSLEPVKHLLDIRGDSVFVFGHQVELAADQAEDAADR